MLTALRALTLRYPGESTIVTGVLVGLATFSFGGKASLDPITIALSALIGGAWGIGWRWSLSRRSQRSN